MASPWKRANLANLGVPGGYVGAGDVGRPAGGGFLGDTPYMTQSPLDDPRFAEILNSIISGIPQTRGVSDMLSQGIQSPLLQAVLQGVLSQLVPGERAARTSMTDRFRMAGAQRDTAYGGALANLESEILGRRGQAVSGTISQFLEPLMRSLLAEQEQQFRGPDIMSRLLAYLRPETVVGRPAQPGGIAGPASQPFGVSNITGRPVSSPGRMYDPWGVASAGRSPWAERGGDIGGLTDWQRYGITPGFDWAAAEQMFRPSTPLPGQASPTGSITYGPWQDPSADPWASLYGDTSWI